MVCDHEDGVYVCVHNQSILRILSYAYFNTHKVSLAIMLSRMGAGDVPM